MLWWMDSPGGSIHLNIYLAVQVISIIKIFMLQLILNCSSLPWLIRACLRVPIAQENIYIGKFSHFIIKLCCVLIRIASSGHSNDYTQQFCVENHKKKSLNDRYCLPNLTLWLTLSGSNYPCLEQLSMVPKIFEPLKFDYLIYPNETNFYIDSSNTNQKCRISEI